MVKKTYFLLVLAAVLTTMLGTVKCDHDDDLKKCGVNMEYSRCGGSCQRTCQDISSMGPPKSCKEACKPGCSCTFGYVLQKGKCIPEKECTCPRNAEYTECNGHCQFSCQDVANMVFKEDKSCPEICIGGCVCKANYALKSGKCVPQKECPCKKNSQYNDCGTCRKTCEDVANNITNKPCPKICKQGCFCDKGYVMSRNTCVLPEQCFRATSS